MREGFHILLTEARELPSFHPWPDSHVCYGILAFTCTSEIVARLIAVFAREVDFEDAEIAEGFGAEAGDGVCGGGRTVKQQTGTM